MRLEPAPVTEEVEDFSAFEANKQSILQWIASLLAGFGIGGDQQPAVPDPIDPAKCKPCSKFLLKQIETIFPQSKKLQLRKSSLSAELWSSITDLLKAIFLPSGGKLLSNLTIKND